jgi:ribonucleoside-diphosphate reductase alpha chain
MLNDKELLSEVVIHNKYAKYIPELSRRETWQELVDRNKAMHIKKHPQLKQDLDWAYQFVLDKKILPSMRSMQFAGKPIESNPARIFNCSGVHVSHYKAFSETMFLLLSGCGVGYSVQKHHVEQLPSILKPNYDNKYPGVRRYLISDDIEGWAESIKILLKSYFFGTNEIRFDYGGIRAKGMRLVTSGGKAPGFEPLEVCINKIKAILDKKEIGTKLKPIEAHDIMCHISNAVLAGGIRRSACLSMFDIDDEEMLTCKSGEWWVENEQRGRCNNSVVLERGKVTKEQFFSLWKKVQESGCGEPGFIWTNNKELLRNPCVEISLRTFCNLCEIDATKIKTQQDFEDAVKAATIIGTSQASYTDFHYLRPFWKEFTEEDALLGIGMTGVASNTIFNLNIPNAVSVAIETNKRIAALIGIKQAKRITTIKPAGTTSTVLGCSSGVHSWHNTFYKRTMRLNKGESLYDYLKANLPELVEDCAFQPTTTAILSIPVKAPDNAITRQDETALDLLERVKFLHQNWIQPGHIEGDDTHNISVTVSIKDNEWEEVGNWMWDNREFYSGISVLPYDGGTYVQAPFQDITEDEYNRLSNIISQSFIDLASVIESEDVTNHTDNVACAGGACEVA